MCVKAVLGHGIVLNCAVIFQRGLYAFTKEIAFIKLLFLTNFRLQSTSEKQYNTVTKENMYNIFIVQKKWKYQYFLSYSNCSGLTNVSEPLGIHALSSLVFHGEQVGTLAVNCFH